MCNVSAPAERAGRSSHHVSVQQYLNFAFRGMHVCLGPSQPKSLIKGLEQLQLSNQKLAKRPLPTSHFKNLSARDLNFKMAFQIHDPCLISSKLQMIAPFSMCSFVHFAYRDSDSHCKSHINFRQRDLFHVEKSYSPYPPFDFGKQIVVHETFTATLDVILPFQRNFAHRDSMAQIQPLGKINLRTKSLRY